MTKERAHELIERIAPVQVPAVVELLEKMLDPVSLALANAPFEDEEISEEEEQRYSRFRAIYCVRDQDLLHRDLRLPDERP